MRYIIDRIEGLYALCEDEDNLVVSISLEELPPFAKEGDILIIQDGVCLVDKANTTRRRKQIQRKMMDLFE